MATTIRLRLKQSHPRLKQEVLAFVKSFVLVLPLQIRAKDALLRCVKQLCSIWTIPIPLQIPIEVAGLLMSVVQDRSPLGPGSGVNAGNISVVGIPGGSCWAQLCGEIGAPCRPSGGED